MRTSTITISVGLDENKVPESISWNASESTAEAARDAKAVILSFWDGKDKSALRMDLWTKEMRVDEMADFYFQTFMTLADSFERATHQPELVEDIKNFAGAFYKKFQQLQLKDQQH
ncbi:MAG: gliding motility protein GldC [Bacteroidota bacterium]|jgi:gliding motility-associated protein GldC